MDLKQRLSEAATYIEAGFRVLWTHGIAEDGACSCGRDPCSSPGKHPVMSGGANAATDSLAQLEAWAKQYPLGNLALATGSVSKFWVLDVDLDHGGLDSLAQLEEEFGPLPVTATVKTGGGGWHYYFRWGNEEIRNRVAVMPGLDIRGDAGYVLAVGSSHVSGVDYDWAEGRALGEVEIAEGPAGLVELAVAKKKTNSAAPLVDGEGIPEGTRHVTLVSLLGSMRRRGMSPEAMKAAALKENERCVPPLDEEEPIVALHPGGAAR